jgi:hypothetical protein
MKAAIIEIFANKMAALSIIETQYEASCLVLKQSA